jgi:hypothetical protein
MTEPSPITIIKRAINLDKPGLLTLLRELGEAHFSFVRQTTNKAAASAALDLYHAHEEIIRLINEDDLLAICHEVRLQVPAVHAANQILKERSHA